MVKFNSIRVQKRYLIWLLVFTMLFVQVMITYAVTPTPIPPTATPIPLTIPTNVIFDSTNNWMGTFAPIVAIGIGISVAIAILGYLGKIIKSAFT